VNRRWLDDAIRAVLFVAFVAYVYSARFAPYREAPFEEAEAVVRAVNAGYPFQLLEPGVNGAPPTVKRITELYGDFGVQLVVSATGSAGRMLFGPSFQVRSQLARVILFGLWVITAAAIVAKPVPLPVAAAGVVSLLVLIVWGPLDLTVARFWGVAYAALVAAVYLGTVLNAWTRPRVAALLVLACLAAYAQLLRQEAAPAFYALGAALVGAAVVTWVAARVRAASGVSAQASVLARRAIAGGLLLIFATGAVIPLERWCLALAWGTPFSETSITGHGAGWPMYLSLGYVSNPYNIAWRDPIGEVHSQLINPGLYAGHPEFQQTLMREYERIAIAAPWLVIRNVLARAGRVHELARAPFNDATGVNSRPFAYAYRAAPWVMLLGLLLLIWRGTGEGALLWICALALTVGASAGALIVFPEYLGGLQGSLLGLVLIVPAAIAGSLRDSATASSPQLARLVLGANGVVLLISAAIALIVVGVQASRARELRKATVALEPAAAIAAQEFRYAHVFNDLSGAQQGRLVAQLLASTNAAVAGRIERAEGDLTLFRPEAVIRTRSQIHVIAWMGREFVPPVPRLFQGATHASLFVCGSCPWSTSVNDIQTGLRWTMIGDLEWQGRYRMFSLPQTPPLQTAASFQVTAERTVRLDYSRPTWLVPQMISRTQLRF